jgi:ATP-dependent helicase Lhr and Lhr-like helicase
LCLLSPWGGRVHAPWALVLQARLRAAGEGQVETIWSDDGLVVRLPERDVPPDAAALLPDPDEIEDTLLRELGGTPLFAAHFREAAARALLLPRRRPGQRSPLWMQRKRASDLLAVAARYGSFPIILETYRECLQDVFDLPGLLDLARKMRARELRVVTVDTASPSPFAASLLFGYVANYIYEGDAPLAERRAQALSVDQAQLRELLGESELRQLLDAEVIVETELSLQGLDEAHRAHSADRLHELLLRVGDLTEAEIVARVRPPEKGEESALLPAELARRFLLTLLDERRALRVFLGGEERLVAAEDAGRLRDAFGIPPPRGLPEVFLEKAPHALRELLARYARTHGPFTVQDVARRFGAGERALLQELEALVESGRVVAGEFRPGGAGLEWCASGVLALLRRRSLARLRRQVEPADPAALARLLVDWQGVATTHRPALRRSGPDALLDVVEQLQGAALNASALERDILTARLPEYRPQDLDLLCAAGEVLWLGLSPLGERDGRVALFLADHVPLLHTPSASPPEGEVHDALRAHLAQYGASFFASLQSAVSGTLARSVLEALWDLVWAGEVTSDSPEALRAFVRPAPATRGAPPRSRRMGTFRSRRQSPPSGVGRWSLVSRTAPQGLSSTARLKAQAEQLLARFGVLTRQAVLAEGLAGGFSALYPVLKTLEEAGRIRRGYFVAGLGGSQFALPGAVDRLRAVRETAAPGDDAEATLPGVVLASTDPANPYGAILPWPAGRLQRAAGTHVVLVDGLLAGYVARGARELTPFLPEEEPLRTQVMTGLARGLAAWARSTGRVALGWQPGEEPLVESLLAPALRAAGFSPWGPGFRLEGAPAPPPSIEADDAHEDTAGTPEEP